MKTILRIIIILLISLGISVAAFVIVNSSGGGVGQHFSGGRGGGFHGGGGFIQGGGFPGSGFEREGGSQSGHSAINSREFSLGETSKNVGIVAVVVLVVILIERLFKNIHRRKTAPVSAHTRPFKKIK